MENKIPPFLFVFVLTNPVQSNQAQNHISHIQFADLPTMYPRCKYDSSKKPSAMEDNSEDMRSCEQGDCITRGQKFRYRPKGVLPKGVPRICDAFLTEF